MRHLSLLLLLFSLDANAANLFTEDTGFETGIQNFNYYRSTNGQIQTVNGDAAEGKSSLEINSAISWAGGRWGYIIKKDTDYTVSFYARRVSGNNEITFTFIGVYDWIWVGEKSFTLTDEWKRYSYHFRTDRDKTVLFPVFITSKDIVFRVDALQLEEGTVATPYQPAEIFSVYPTVGLAEVVHTPGTTKLTVNLFNAGVETDNFTLRIKAPNISREVPFRLKKGSASKEVVELPEASLPGYYPVTVEIIDATGKIVKSTAAPFVVTNPFPKMDKPGFFGLEISPMPNNALPLIGVSWLRTRTPPWKALEIREGKFKDFSVVWKKPDPLFWHPTLDGLSNTDEIPSWGIRQGGKKADLAKATVFLDHVFQNLKGKTEFIDFINEPYLAFRDVPDKAEYYSELIRMAAPIARKYDVKLLIDVSGGCNFFSKVQADAGDCFDIVSLHPYTSTRIFAKDGRYVASPEKGEFVTSLRDQAALARKYGKEFLIGELGYSLEETVPFNDPMAHRFASYLARMFLIARSYPDCRYLNWFYGLDRWEAGPYLYGIWRTENGIRPLPAVAAYAQAAHEIDYAKNVKWVFDGDIKVLRYEKNGQTSYAVWDATDDADTLPLTLPEGASPRSIYGSPLTSPVISGSPVYLSENAKGTVLPAVMAAINTRSPLDIHGYMTNINTMKFRIYNRSFKDWTGRIKIAPSYQNNKLKILRQTSTTIEAKFPALAPSAKLSVEMCEANGKTFKKTIKIPVMQKVPYLKVANLKTFDFLHVPNLIQQSERVDVFPADPTIPWRDSDDLSHRTLIGWDDSYLYIFSEVRDDDHVNPYTDSESWQGDSLQVGIDSFNDGDGKLSYDSDDHEFTFALGKKAWSHQGPPTRETPASVSEVQQYITRDEKAKTTTYRIAIPRQLLGPLKIKENVTFGLSLCFNDEDPNESRYYMNFGGGIGNIKCPALFKKMLLVR